MENETEVPYLALNNLDLLDEEYGTLESDVACISQPNPAPYEFDETLDEAYENASAQELLEATYHAFYDGPAAGYTNNLPRHETVKYMDLPEEQKLVLGAERFLFGHVRRYYGSPRPEVSLMDRVQNANLDTAQAALSFDDKRKNDFIAYIKPHLDNNIKQAERGASPDLHQGDIIRVPGHRTGYYQAKSLLHGLSASARIRWSYDSPIELDEAISLSWITLADEAVEQYRQYNVEYQPLYRTPEVEDIIDDDPETQPGARLLSEAATEAVLSYLSPERRELLDSRLDINGKPPKKLREIAESEGLTKQAIAARLYQLAKKLQEIPAVHDLLYD